MKIKINFQNAVMFSLGGMFLVILIFSIYISLNKKSEIEESSLPRTDLGQSETIKLKYNYQGSLPEIEKSLKIFYVEEDKVLTKEKSNNIAKSFGINSNPKLLSDIDGTVYLFNEDNLNLLIYPNPFKAVYNDLSEPKNVVLTEDQLLSKAKKFVKEKTVIERPYSLGKSFLNLKKTNFEGILIEARTINETEFAEIEFLLNLDGYPVIEKVFKNNPIYLLLNMDGSINKARFTLLSNNLKEVGKKSITKTSEALEALNNGLGTISVLENPELGYTEIGQGQIKNANLNSVEIVYVYDQELKLITPYYRFSGICETNSGDKLNVEVLITALPDEVYKK